MGLFSFIKDAGKKVFGGGDEPEAKKKEQEVELSKAQALKKEVEQLGIPVTGLEVSLSELVTIKGQTETTAEREKLIVALGNINKVGAVEDHITVANPEPEATFHVVEKGDTLSKISKAVYGDPMKYNTIFEANKPMLSDPDKIYPGQTLRIPAL